MGRSAPTVAAETPAGWLPARNASPVVVVVAGPVVVVAGPVVVGAMVVGAMLVVATSVVVDATVLVGTVVVGRVVVVDALVLGPAVVGGAVVVGPAVVGGAVTVGWVVAPTVEGAVVGVVPPTVAGTWAAADPVVVVGPLTARRPGFAVVEAGGAVGVSRGAVVVVVVDADVGAGCVGAVGCATPGTRRGGSGWGSRVAEATMAASTAVVSPKTNSSSLQGRRGVARCRGGGVGMVHRPGLTCSFRLKGVRRSRTLTGHKGRGSAQRIERYAPVSSRSFCRCR
jgi:hypothetical protein